MENQIYQFNSNVDCDLLLQEAQDTVGYNNYFDPISKVEMTTWKIKHVTSGYGLKISQYWADCLKSNSCKPRFYNQETGYTLKFHKDRGTLCSINYVLSGKSGGVTFGDGIIVYECALLNTQLLHSVPSQNENRILFKVSIFDLSYEDVKNILKTSNIEYVYP
jgi:hypothetical protein